MTALIAPPTVDVALAAGLRWLYATIQPDDALVERRGARIKAGDRVLRFLPISTTGNPLIVVDLPNVRRGISSLSPPLNALPPDELPSPASELAALGIPSAAQHYHGITGTIVLDVPAHRSLIAAVRRYDRGCPRHQTQLGEAPVRDGGKGCTWHVYGHRRAIWPIVDTHAAILVAPPTRDNH